MKRPSSPKPPHLELSKLLSFALRHRPAALGLTLDTQAWCDVSLLLEQLAARGRATTREVLQELVDTCDKQRYSFSEDGLRIRANQGHTAPGVAITFEQKTPPAVLFHGTVEKALTNIFAEGLKPRQRHHVHLSERLDTATDVGARRGAPVLLEVDAAAMHQDGLAFFISKNGVWLTDSVPAKYLRLLTA